MSHTESVLARAWRRARARNLQKEGFLEDALAAALEAPGVWAKLVRHLGWDRFPSATPEVTTQDIAPDGRTDITLRWTDRDRCLILELKTDDPPGRDQVERYLLRGDVAAIARTAGRLDVPPQHGHEFLGVVSWSRIRSMEYRDAPVPLRQLFCLLDSMEVIMSEVTPQALSGMLASWDTWNAIQSWSYRGMDAARQVLEGVGFSCVFREKRQRARIDMTQRRVVWWMYPLPWKEDSLSVYGGLFMGNPIEGDPVCEAGQPDLVLALHLDPDSVRGKRLLGDRKFRRCVSAWRALSNDGVCREFHPDDGMWEILRCRESATKVMGQADQGKAVLDWMEARAQEWVGSKVAHRLAALLEEGSNE